MESLFQGIEREVWETLRKLNDAWTKGDGKDLENFFHKDMVAITPTDRNRREGRDDCVAGWVGFLSMAKVHRWEEIDPKIQVYGDSAVVTYYFDMAFEAGGQMIEMSGRDMFIFVKEDGKWWAVADQFSPYPQPQ
ncbi:MAG: nuclear transport factor 2 family protein [Proteobacteria bacterium]|nr:nuclear transport factor 2 family protein [Pseudomonadota bacterium]